MGITSKLPGKGHDYGLFSVGAAIKLPLSGRHVLVDFEPQLLTCKVTPVSVLRAILTQISSQLSHPFIYLIDSAFVSQEIISQMLEEANCLWCL